MTTPNDPGPTANVERFTVDGSDALEGRIQEINQRVTADIRAIVPAEKIDALVLAGGYGRGEGGVYVKEGKETLYNDLDYYLFLSGNKHENERLYGQGLKDIEKSRSPEADCDVEFKIDSIEELEASPVSMFSYDLVERSAIVDGSKTVFERCAKHRQNDAIPLAEATRLMFNRCSGLIFSRERLKQSPWNPEDLEFVQRNLAKIQLAMGDAVLTAVGQYHWSCLERQSRMNALSPPEGLGEWESLKTLYDTAVRFKLRPNHPERDPTDMLEELAALATSAQSVWYWLEQKRLGQIPNNPRDYATTTQSLCPEQPVWRNVLVNLRRFGKSALFHPHKTRYPREQLFRAMALLLWDTDEKQGTSRNTLLHQLLWCPSKDPKDLIPAYETLWHAYG